ncbi:MAG TPA: aldolase/citrate lyase family protein [Opitutaceae bacterium]|nr:aldolase/citrate lyase family protein [Opitutaceae bacterium]
MKLPPSRILSLLRESRFPAVLKLNLIDPRIAEVAGATGVDALWLCQEHVPNDWLNLENMIRAARIHGIDTLVRVSRGAYSDYIRPLEAGATGIIVPHVADADEARQMVEWTRFHPIGKRALDGGNIDGQFCLVPQEEYLRHSNTERLIVLQIESPEALEHVEAIAAVPGFNGFLFGPGDFSHRIGLTGQITAPAVVEARRRVARAARAHGKFAMCAGLFAPVADLIAEGHSVFSVGADVVGIANYITERLGLLRSQVDKLPQGAAPKIQSPYG